MGTMTDTLQHELNRINTMTDKMLHARYDKMTKRPKITAFFDALTQTGRAPQLREKVGVRLGYISSKLQNTNTYHYLTNGEQIWRFEPFSEGSIQIGSRGWGSDDREWLFNHVDYVNAHYPTDQARDFWNNLVKKGFVTCSLS